VNTRVVFSEHRMRAVGREIPNGARVRGRARTASIAGEIRLQPNGDPRASIGRLFERSKNRRAQTVSR
jgi:hypothetical protein